MSKLITVNYNQKPCYNIVIENDFSKLAENVTKLEISGRKLAVITDSNVGPLYADKVAQCLKETVSLYLHKKKKLLIFLGS